MLCGIEIKESYYTVDRLFELICVFLLSRHDLELTATVHFKANSVMRKHIVVLNVNIAVRSPMKYYISVWSLCLVPNK